MVVMVLLSELLPVKVGVLCTLKLFVLLYGSPKTLTNGDIGFLRELSPTRRKGLLWAVLPLHVVNKPCEGDRGMVLLLLLELSRVDVSADRLY